MRYADLEAGSDRARSTAWFNNLVNRGPEAVSPPTQETFAGFARLFGVTPQDVALMIAEEWYGARQTELSARVRGLAPRLDRLSNEDAALVEALVQRLQPTD